MAKTSDSPVLASSVGFADAAFNELGRAPAHRRPSWLHARHQADCAGCREPAAAPGVAFRRAVRRLVGCSDLLRLGRRAGTRDRRALRRRRRRALGGLPLASRRVVGIASAQPARSDAAATWRRTWVTCCRFRRRARDRFAILACRRITRAPASTATSSSTSRRRAISTPGDLALATRDVGSVRVLPPRLRGLPVARSDRPRDVRRRQDLSGRRHPDQGRQDEHGGLARGAGAAARSQAARVRRPRARRL